MKKIFYKKEGEPVGHEPGVVGDRLDPGLADVGGVRGHAVDGLQIGGVIVFVLHVENEALVVNVQQVVRG